MSIQPQSAPGTAEWHTLRFLAFLAFSLQQHL
jgi:hypothetical protein